MRVLALALVALALVAPSALGQLGLFPPAQFTVFASDPGKAFVPGATEVVSVTVTYGPGQAGRPAPSPTAEEPEDTQPTRITFALKQAPSWVDNVSFEPPEALVQMGIMNATQTSFTRTVQALLNVSPEAPALQREAFVVTATAEPNGNIAGATAESAPLNLRATTVGELNVTAESVVIVPGGRWTTIDFAVRNDGNARILAKLNVTLRPENSQVEFLDTVEIERDETVIVPVRLRTPWTNAEFGGIELEAVPIVEGEEGTPSRATVDVRGESAVPGAGGALAAISLVAVARLLRRR